MSKVQILRALVNQRLTAVVDEICGLVETTIAEYEDIVSRSKEEAEQQRKLFEAVVSAGVDLHKTDFKQLFAVKEDKREWRSVLNQNTPDLPNIKEEPEQFQSSQEGPQLQGLQKYPFPGVPVNSGSQEGQQQRYPYVFKALPAEAQQGLMCEREAPSGQQEGRPTLKQGNPAPPLIKEEQETPWSSQEGEWNGEDREKAHQRQTEENRGAESASSSAQQMETDGEDFGGAEPSLQSDKGKTSNSSDSMTEDSDDEWKRMPSQQSNFKLRKDTKIPGSEPTKKLGPASDLNPGSDLKPAIGLQPAGQDNVLDSSEAETEDSDDDWNHGSKPQARLVTVKTKEVSESSSKSSCQIKKTSFCCSTCGKRFHCKQQLRKHTKTHSQGATFHCPECGKQFIHKANLSKHMRSHSLENLLNGSASEKCKDRASVKTKKTKHSKEKSLICDKSCRKKGAFALHMKMYKVDENTSTHTVGRVSDSGRS